MIDPVTKIRSLKQHYLDLEQCVELVKLTYAHFSLSHDFDDLEKSCDRIKGKLLEHVRILPEEELMQYKKARYIEVIDKDIILFGDEIVKLSTDAYLQVQDQLIDR
jgi:hypothetical protein